MINLDLGRFGKVRIAAPSPLEIVALVIVLAFATVVIMVMWR
jgi:hypothetical protein